jgi:DNA-binding LacI/PurR family transcriptional regulator
MDELNYTPNIIAGSLRKKKTNIIGIVIPDVSHEILSTMLKKFEERLYSEGYNIIVCNSSYNLKQEEHIIRMMKSRRVDGLIIMPTDPQVSHILDITQSETPIIILDRDIGNAKVDLIEIEHWKGYYEITEYLISNGHRLIGYIDRKFDQSHSIQRKKGFFDALEDKNIQIPDELIIRAEGFSYEDGYKAAKILLNKKNKPTAIFGYNDNLAIGIIRAVRECGLSVPEDVSVVGADDIEVGKYFFPRLTTIHYPSDEIVEATSQLIMERIQKQGEYEPTKIVFPYKSIIRDSIAPAKGAI